MESEPTTDPPVEDGTSIIEKSPAQDFINKVDRRDKVVRVLEVIVLFLLTAFNVFMALQINNSIKNNEATAIKAREVITSRQHETQKYIRCIILIRFNEPPITETSSKAVVEEALDKCASEVQ